MKRNYSIICLLGLLSLLGTTAKAQTNLETFTPAILFPQGQWEINSFYNMYTQTAVRDREGNKVDLGQRQTFLNIMYMFTIGATKDARLNVGLDLNLARSFYDNEDSSPLKVIFSTNSEIFDRFVVAGLGPRIRVVPIGSIPNLSIQSAFWFPISQNMEEPLFTAHDRYTWFTQFFYDWKLSDKFRLFLEADFLMRFRRFPEQTNFFRTPISAFVNYFPLNKLQLFVFGQYAPRFQNVPVQGDEPTEVFGLNQYFTQLGLGAKYQATKKLIIEYSYSNFIDSKNDGAGYTLNLGIRYIH